MCIYSRSEDYTAHTRVSCAAEDVDKEAIDGEHRVHWSHGLIKVPALAFPLRVGLCKEQLLWLAPRVQFFSALIAADSSF